MITCFLKDSESEALVDEISLSSDISLGELQNVFKIEKDNPMYDCYQITECEVDYFIKSLGINFNLKKYDYYVECYSDD